VCNVVGSMLYVIGSVCFLPSTELSKTGAMLFLIGSVLFVIGPALLMWEVSEEWVLSDFTKKNYVLENLVQVQYLIGALLFLLGSFIYLDPTLPVEMFTYAAWEFIIGSMFFTNGALTCYVRVKLQRSTNEENLETVRRASSTSSEQSDV